MFGGDLVLSSQERQSSRGLGTDVSDKVYEEHQLDRIR